MTDAYVCVGGPCDGEWRESDGEYLQVYVHPEIPRGPVDAVPDPEIPALTAELATYKLEPVCTPDGETYYFWRYTYMSLSRAIAEVFDSYGET